jgi:2-C-methyl-D-erythritol 4-phosphate cytidylyltransferase
VSPAASSDASGALGVVAIVAAAGSGTRLGGGVRKALRPLAGHPLVWHAVRSLLDSGWVERVVVAAAADDVTSMAEMLDDPRVNFVVGGTTRQQSVALALAAIDEARIVVVHDAARPLVPARVVRDVVAAVNEQGATAVDGAIPVLELHDTVKRVDADGLVQETPDRSALRAVQTPQAFRADSLRAAHARAAGTAEDETLAATDDAALVEAWGGRVVIVEGSEDAIKVTRPFDLMVAEAILAERAAAHLGTNDESNGPA